MVTLAHVIAQGASGDGHHDSHGTTETVIDWIILGLVLFLIANTFLTRRTSRPPGCMGKLQQARPQFAFLLGLRLLGVLVLGQRAQVVLPKVRDWMKEVVLIFFVAITMNSLVGG